MQKVLDLQKHGMVASVDVLSRDGAAASPENELDEQDPTPAPFVLDRNGGPLPKEEWFWTRTWATSQSVLIRMPFWPWPIDVVEAPPHSDQGNPRYGQPCCIMDHLNQQYPHTMDPFLWGFNRSATSWIVCRQGQGQSSWCLMKQVMCALPSLIVDRCGLAQEVRLHKLWNELRPYPDDESIDAAAQKLEMQRQRN